MSAATDLEQLAEHANDRLREATAPPLLSVARGLLNETQIVRRHDALERARRVVRDAPDIVKAAREALATQQERLRQASEQFDQAIAEAEWALDNRIAREGNRTFIVTWHQLPDSDMARADAEADGWTPVPGKTDVFEERRQVTADEAAKWRTRSALRQVGPAKQARDSAEQAVAVAKVDVDFAENRWQAARAELDACRTDADLSIAQLATLARSLDAAR